MAAKKPIRLFVTHCFSEHEEYARVFEYLESRDNFYYVNFSDPDFRPAGGNQEALQEALHAQIKNVEILVFPVGVHSVNPQLVDYQLRCAKACKLPILAIKAFGGTLAVSKEALAQADVVVEWNDRVIVDNIRRLARNEDTGQWDVIEFDMD